MAESYQPNLQSLATLPPELLEERMTTLPERWQYVIRARLSGKTQTEVAWLEDVKRQVIHEMEQRAIQALMDPEAKPGNRAGASQAAPPTTEAVLKAMDEHKGDRPKVAIALGINERTLQVRLHRIKKRGMTVPYMEDIAALRATRRAEIAAEKKARAVQAKLQAKEEKAAQKIAEKERLRAEKVKEEAKLKAEAQKARLKAKKDKLKARKAALKTEAKKTRAKGE